MNTRIIQVTERIIERSKDSRRAYLARVAAAAQGTGTFRSRLPCSNFAHDLAGCPASRPALLAATVPNIGIISAYNDLLSAHQPLGAYPEILKEAVAEAGGIAQFAGGVPAMCDGITQGEAGMDLSLMSRDVIALSTVIALSHGVFDGALLLGVCDKIVPGLLMGALQYGHLPMILIPAGPMPSGISNHEKNQVRERFAQGKASREDLLESELRAYHSPGTCTFYGTANSNQLMVEMLGLHLPGASFVTANTPLRQALTRAAAQRLTGLTHLGKEYTPLAQVLSEKAVVNALVGLLSTGASTNETIHLVAIAKAAGICITWDDFADLSEVVPLLLRIYPNGLGDINAFQQAGGMALLIRRLREGGFLHEDVLTVAGQGLAKYTEQPLLQGDSLHWQAGPEQSQDPSVLASLNAPFAPISGIKVVSGNLGRAIMKISALPEGEATCVEAPALVYNSQQEMEGAFKAGKMFRDAVVVLRFQGPRANGMPELHKLITLLSILMDQGHRVGLLTDGRLSGASGKVPFAIHCTPEALNGGLLAKVEDGDIIRIDAKQNMLELFVDAAILAQRLPSPAPPEPKDIFAPLRRILAGAEAGASSLFEG